MRTDGARVQVVPDLDLADFDYALPGELVAQQPLAEREASRMLVLERESRRITHEGVRALPRWLRAGDLLVVNTTRVVPAKLRGRKETGGAAEALLLGEAPDDPGRFLALVGCRGRLRVGGRFVFSRGSESVQATIRGLHADGVVSLEFDTQASPYAVGETPLPPYIRRNTPDPDDASRYQAVFAREPGSVAAPTASLHLSEALLDAVAAAGIERAEVVLHVGAGTFRPVSEASMASGRLHPERFVLPTETADAIARTRERGGRVVAVGTTVTRVLEACATRDRRVTPARGETDIFLRPGHSFHVVDALLTNFHLPRSSLLLLAAAFVGREPLLAAYAEAVTQRYRFFSYGDCMLVL